MDASFHHYLPLKLALEKHVQPNACAPLNDRQFRRDLVLGRLRGALIHGRWHVDPTDIPRYLADLVRPNSASAA